MPIIVSESGKNAQKLDRRVIDREEYLQHYIYGNPEVLPLDEYKTGARLVVLAREFSTDSGSIDALGVDQDGEVYVVETKLYRNPDKRLVLAQMLDYGASLWKRYSDPQDFISALRDTVSANFGVSLSQKLGEALALTDAGVDELLEAMRERIENGSFRFVILMDRLDDRLKDLITFVNHNSRFDVFGVELDFYQYKDFEILIPRLYGAEVKKSVRRSPSVDTRKKWDEESFFEDVCQRLDDSQVQIVRRIYEWAVEKSNDIVWGTSINRGSFNPRFDHVSSRSVFSVYSDGELSLNFGWLTELGGSQYAEKLALTLRHQGILQVPEDFWKRHISFPITEWGPKAGKVAVTFEEVLLP